MYVRYDDVRTFVKGVECVPAFCDDAYMANGQTAGEILVALKERADVPLEVIAKRGGYKGKSSVQEYFKTDFEGPLGGRVASKLATALEGLGVPAITREEVLRLADIPISNVVDIRAFDSANLQSKNEPLPIYGTALGGEAIVAGEAIEQTTLNTGDVIGYAKRPAMLTGQTGIYCLYVAGSSMVPRHDDGALLVVRRGAPLRSGDDVVIYLRPQGENDDGERAERVLVKSLVRRTSQFYELKQYSPEMVFRIAADDVVHADRVIPLAEMIS